tara:strand:- start:2468 stop:3310 length:843 start_codon:yes stop_codon:yes gene_type:complete
MTILNLSSDKVSDIKKLSNKIRKKILFTSLHAGASSAHIGGALSYVEIISCLYTCFIKYNLNNPEDRDRDRFILSKGHGCLAYYSVLTEIGFINEEDLLKFEKTNSFLLGHPTINRKKGIEFSNGSLGMGLSLGIGVAISLKKNNISREVYVLLGDGECNEGSVWEAMMCASSLNLDNITIIIDKNKFQQTGSTKDIIQNNNLYEKIKNFDWNTIEVDGHDINQLISAFSKKFNNEKPKAVIANTIKGKGISFIENDNNWHHSILTQKNYDEAIKELGYE